MRHFGHLQIIVSLQAGQRNFTEKLPGKIGLLQDVQFGISSWSDMILFRHFILFIILLKNANIIIISFLEKTKKFIPRN